MKSLLLTTGFLILLCTSLEAQSRFSEHEVSFNFFRNPSIGLEYRYKQVSVHVGYYLTAFESGVTWEFAKIGATIWYLPVGDGQNPSSFYTQFNLMRGLNRDYEGLTVGSVDTGFRAIFFENFNFRLGVNAVFAEDKTLKINPTPSLNYSLFF